jgi:hypothetical protein
VIDFGFLAAEQSTNELLVQANKDYNSARRVWWTLTGALAGMGVAYLAKQPNGVQVVAGAIGGGGAYLLTKRSEEKAETAVAGSAEQT